MGNISKNLETAFGVPLSLLLNIKQSLQKALAKTVILWVEKSLWRLPSQEMLKFKHPEKETLLNSQTLSQTLWQYLRRTALVLEYGPFKIFLNNA